MSRATIPRTKYPIESFGPELMAALLRGGRSRLMLTFLGDDGAGKRKAHQFQRRIQMLRTRMRQDNHADYMLATKARVSIFWGPPAVVEGAPTEWLLDPKGDLGAIIILRPHDSEYTEILAAAGITVPSPHTTPPLSEPQAQLAPAERPAKLAPARRVEEPDPPGNLDDLLDDLLERQQKDTP